VFIQREADTGELVAIQVSGDGVGGLISPILDFRLDSAGRQRATERALAAGSCGIPRDTIRELDSALAPGAAIAALLVKHVWAEALADAVARTGGTPLLTEFVEPTTLAELVGEIRSALAPQR
jgi:hypothetical protein